jgi:catechol 2,3-dioxygenase-like lactoylglutathione lyase family enzyme
VHRRATLFDVRDEPALRAELTAARDCQFAARARPRVHLRGADVLIAPVDEEGSMTIVLNHTIVPARDKVAAARFFARIFGLKISRKSDYFAPVRVNKTLTLLFDDETKFDSHHYAFHVSKAEFDVILARIKKAGIKYGSAPWSLDDGQLNDWNGGRGVYFRDLNGHVLELMTVPQ